MKLRLPPGQPWWYIPLMYVGMALLTVYDWCMELRCRFGHDDIDMGLINEHGRRVDVCLRCGRIKEHKE